MKPSSFPLPILLLLALTLTGCQLISTLISAGLWLIIVAVIAVILIIWLIIRAIA